MQAHKHHFLFVVRHRMTRLRLHLYGRATASLVALALCAPGWAAPRSPEQASTLPGLPQVEQDAASPSADVRRQALRALRERGGPETLPLLARLVGDAEIDIREDALANVILVYVPSRPDVRSIARLRPSKSRGSITSHGRSLLSCRLHSSRPSRTSSHRSDATRRTPRGSS